MIIDIIIILIIILFSAMGARRGIARTILNLVGLAVTFGLAYYLSRFLSQGFYDLFIGQTVANNIDSLITANGLDYAVTNSAQALPSWVYNAVVVVVSIFGGDISDFGKSVQTSVNNAVSVTSQTFENAVQSSVVGVFNIVFFVILLIAVFIAVRLLIKLVLKLFEAPVIKQANRLLGGVLGFAEGVIVALLAVNIFYAIISFTNPEFFSSELFDVKLFSFLLLKR